MTIIFGLGNPGKKFKGTRHNFGREVVDLLQKKWAFSDWQKKAKLKAEISKGEFAGKEILLAKSQTFMNESGKPAKKLTYKFKLPTSKLWIIHDDLDLPLGKIKISQARGAGGHRGVESVIKELGTKNFLRFRIGIKPTQASRIISRSKNFVLGKFKKEEKAIVKESIKKTIEAVKIALSQSLEKAMQEFN